MPDTIGPHLLGRRPSPRDDRDFQLVHFVDNADPLDAVTAALLASTAHPAVRAWAKVATPRIKAASPAPVPVPPAPPGDVVWGDSDAILDQGNTGHCVGFGWCGWGDTLPIDDHYANTDGDAVYYECKVIDGEPGAEDGSDVRSGAKAMQNRKRLSAYAFASSIDQVRAWLDGHGPVVFGTEWSNAMFTPDANGFVSPADAVRDPSQIAGSHCFVCVGDVPSKGALEFQNSWGASWGAKGRFFMTVADAAVLLKGIQSPGEACASIELPA